MRFFVSSTYEDLKKIRGVAINMLKDITGAKTASISAMESFPASPSSSSAFCLNQLDGADIMIGIYGFRFGSKGEDGRSLTEIEFDEAVKNGTKILAFVADGAEYTQDTDQQHFLQTKVSSLGGVWARFDPNNLGTFATVLNESLKNYLNGYEGYSYHSIWDDIIELKHEISKDDGIPRLIPYGENEEEKALDDIIESANFFSSVSEKVSIANECAYNLAYYYDLADGTQSDEYDQEIKNAEYEMIKTVKENSSNICGNWEYLNIGHPNSIKAILMAANYLKLCYVQKKLLTELWTENLRQEILSVKKFYLNLAGKENNIIAD